MMKRQILDFVPTTRNGEIIYMPARSFSGLGVVTAQAQTNAGNAVGIVSAATTLLPNKPVTHQSNFSKVANVCATIAGVVAAIPPAGTVVAVVALVVAGVCILLGKLFANSKAKKYAAERREYEKVNSQIKYENQQLDLQYMQASKAIDDLQKAIGGLSGTGSRSVALYGLGSKASREKAKLQGEKDLFEALSKEQTTKSQLLMSIVDEFNKLMKSKFELSGDKSTNDYLMWILGGSALILGGYYAYQNKSKIQKEISK